MPSLGFCVIWVLRYDKNLHIYNFACIIIMNCKKTSYKSLNETVVISESDVNQTKQIFNRSLSIFRQNWLQYWHSYHRAGNTKYVYQKHKTKHDITSGWGQLLPFEVYNLPLRRHLNRHSHNKSLCNYDGRFIMQLGLNPW